MSWIPNEEDLGQKCESCGDGHYRDLADFNQWWVKCDDCGALKFCYKPLPHQEDFHKDPSKYRMFAGGYGSGKTRTTTVEILRHVLETPNGMTLMGAATLPQLENTSKKDFMEMVPRELYVDFNQQKNRMTFVNGHVVLFRPLDSESKARSLNLSAFHIEEASEVAYEYFVQLQTRLRNTATKNHIGILSSNPENCWIRSEFLLRSGKIHNAEENYSIAEEDMNHNFSSHIAPTKLNTYLPPTFYEDTARGKAAWWIARYLDGSFKFADGMVYPMFQDHVVDPFPIPKNWQRIGGADFGLRDPTCLVLGAIDPETGTVYIYDEYGEAEKPLSYHARMMKSRLDEIPSGALMKLVGDPSGKRKTASDPRSLFHQYADYGIFFQPGDNRIETGISKVYNYFALDRLKIFNTCRMLIQEGTQYRYKPQSLDDKSNPDEKPFDKANHYLDSKRYLMMELPDDPDNLINESFSSVYYGGRKQTSLPPELQDNEPTYSPSWTSY